MPLTIKPITIKPVKLGAAPAGVSPSGDAASAPAAPVAPAAPAAPAAHAAPAAPAAHAAPSGIRPIVIAPRPAAAPSGAAPAPTIHLKPVTPAPHVPAPPPSGSVAAPAADAPKAQPPKPAAPRPVVIAPPASRDKADPASAAEAAKGKTSRISLDEALATTTSAGARIAMGRLTTNLSGAAAASAPSPAADSSEAPTLRKKPLVLKKAEQDETPAATGESEDDKPTLRLKPASGGGAAPAASKPKITLKGASAAPAAPVSSTNDAIEAPPPAFGGNALEALAKPEKVSVLFPIVAAAALVVALGVCLLFASQWSGPDPSLTQFSSWRDGPSFICPGTQRVAIR